MFSIFTSSKRLVLKSSADANAVLRLLRERTTDEDLETSIMPTSVRPKYLSRFSGRDVQITCTPWNENSLRPTINVHVEGAPSGGCVILTRYSTSIFARVLICMWFAFMGFGLLFPQQAAHIFAGSNSAPFFLLFGLAVMVSMRVSARSAEQQLEQFIRDLLADAEREPLNESPPTLSVPGGDAGATITLSTAGPKNDIRENDPEYHFSPRRAD